MIQNDAIIDTHITFSEQESNAVDTAAGLLGYNSDEFIRRACREAVEERDPSIGSLPLLRFVNIPGFPFCGNRMVPVAVVQ